MSPAPTSRVALTPRQRDILVLRAGRGLTLKETAHELGVTIPTVRHHTQWILERTGARSLVHAAFLARREIEEFVA